MESGDSASRRVRGRPAAAQPAERPAGQLAAGDAVVGVVRIAAQHQRDGVDAAVGQRVGGRGEPVAVAGAQRFDPVVPVGRQERGAGGVEQHGGAGAVGGQVGQRRGAQLGRAGGAAQAGEERIGADHALGDRPGVDQRALAEQPHRIDRQQAARVPCPVDGVVVPRHLHLVLELAPGAFVFALMHPDVDIVAGGALRGGGTQFTERRVGQVPAGGVGRLQRQTRLGDQRGDGLVQRFGVVRFQPQPAGVEHHQVVPRGVDMDRLQAGPGAGVGGSAVGQAHVRRGRQRARRQSGVLGQPALVRQRGQVGVVVALAAGLAGAGKQPSRPGRVN